MAQELAQHGLVTMVPGTKYPVVGFTYKGAHVLADGPASIQVSLDGTNYVQLTELEDLANGTMIEIPGFIRYVRIADNSTAEVLLSVQQTGVAG